MPANGLGCFCVLFLLCFILPAIRVCLSHTGSFKSPRTVLAEAGPGSQVHGASAPPRRVLAHHPDAPWRIKPRRCAPAGYQFQTPKDPLSRRFSQQNPPNTAGRPAPKVRKSAPRLLCMSRDGTFRQAIGKFAPLVPGAAGGPPAAPQPPRKHLGPLRAGKFTIYYRHPTQMIPLTHLLTWLGAPRTGPTPPYISLVRVTRDLLPPGTCWGPLDTVK